MNNRIIGLAIVNLVEKNGTVCHPEQSEGSV